MSSLISTSNNDLHAIETIKRRVGAPSKRDLYANEQQVIYNMVILTLNTTDIYKPMNKHGKYEWSFTHSIIDKSPEIQAQLMSLLPSCKRYFNINNSAIAKNKPVKRPWLSLVRIICKRMGRKLIPSKYFTNGSHLYQSVVKLEKI